jgi:excisionase family DNA binding protein
MADYLTTRELADLLRIKERKVYDLAASGEVPCSKAMGKLLFPRAAVHAWPAERSSGVERFAGTPLPNVFLGSHDPLLDWALRESRCGIATFFDGSSDGLARFARREGVATGLHIYEPATDSWNEHTVAEQFGTRPIVLISWAKRQRGLIVAAKPRRKIESIADLTGRRVTPRQAESGAQALFGHLLERAGLSPDKLNMTAPARTEADAALAVLEGKADAAFGLASFAAQYRLPFVPLIEERFDLLVDRRAWFLSPMQTFLAFCRSQAFLDRARELAGYDVSEFGTVHFNGP